MNKPVLVSYSNSRYSQKYRAFALIFLVLGQEARAFVDLSGPAPSNSTSSNFRKPKNGAASTGEAAAQSNRRRSTSYTPLHLNGTVSARRLTVLGARYETGPTLDAGGNPLTNIKGSPETSTNIVVTAGASYSRFIIYANQGLGTDLSLIRVKLVPMDMGLATCEEVQPEMSTQPFNGEPNVASVSGISDTKNLFPRADGFRVIFPRAGRFKLCYTRNSKKWEVLERPTITVVGGSSSTMKAFCAKSIMSREICKIDFTTEGCECKIRIDGFHFSNGIMQKTGLPNPVTVADPAKDSLWVAITQASRDKCGDGAGANAVPYSNKRSKVVNGDGYEIHNFGYKFENNDPGVWKICYCPNFDHQVIAGDPACIASKEKDFPQLVGRIFTVDVEARVGPDKVSVYPTLKFSLAMLCGSDGTTGDGGCEKNKDVRYKIVEHKPENDKLYFESSAGCRMLHQVKSQVVELPNTKFIGGHLSPLNCEDAVACTDEPEVESEKTPTWYDIQIDSSYQNRILIETIFDVCYCDKSCGNSQNWFKAGEIPVKPPKVTIWDKQLREPLATPIVNTPYYFQIEGPSGAGSWSTTGSKTREMKILSDPHALADKDVCLQKPQPDMISGHTMQSGFSDYAEPTSEVYDIYNKLIGFRYGEVRANMADPTTARPDIKIGQAGWIAVCYCDSQCNQRTNWAVFAWKLIRGPKPDQTFTVSKNLPFNLEILGYGLESTNRVKIVGFDNEVTDCGRSLVQESQHVFGPVGNNGKAIMKESPEAAQMTTITWNSEGLGSVISFGATHGLRDGDVIELYGVRIIVTGGDPEKEAMFNTAHRVFPVCDVVAVKNAENKVVVPACHKVLIQVMFTSLEFPSAINTESATWIRSNTQKYQDIRISKESPEGRGYVICWSQLAHDLDGFVGQVGKVTVKEAVLMPYVDTSVSPGTALLSLTTIQAGVTAPVIITFETGDHSQYTMAQNSMQMKIVFQSEYSVDETAKTTTTIKTLEPKMWDGSGVNGDQNADELHEAHQAACGRFFLELWTTAPRGFPQPKGCYYNEDKTNPKQPLWQFYIVFNAKNHLTANSQYQIVMNAEATEALGPEIPNDGAVHVWSMDDTVTNLNGVVELGKGFPIRKRSPSEASDATALDSHFHPTSGFKIVPNAEGDTTVLTMTGFCKFHVDDGTDRTPKFEDSCKPCESEKDCGNTDPTRTWCVSPIERDCAQVNGDLTKQPAFAFQLRGKIGSNIKPGHIIRVMLQPFTQWRLHTLCYVAFQRCSAQPNPQFAAQNCGDPVCEAETAVKGKQDDKTQINVLKITLHQMSTSIGPEEDDRAEIGVGNLPLPPGGFFPTIVTAELQKSQGERPVYWGSLGIGSAKLYYRPRTTVASIVTKIGDGNPNFYVSEPLSPVYNTIFVKIVLGATLHAAKGGDVSIDIDVPEEYKCDMIDQGRPAPHYLKIFEELQPEVPNGNGTLGGSSHSWEVEGKWRSIMNEEPLKCRFTFSRTMVVYAGASLYAQLTVENPAVPKVQFDPSGKNSWYLNVAKTERGKSYKAHKKEFSGNNQNLGPNLSVLGKLNSVVITPTNFGAGQQNMMMIFFKTQQQVGTKEQKKTEIWVDAPPGYDFGQFCKADHLHENYYVPVEPPEFPTRRLPTGVVIGCIGGLSRVGETTYNRAKVRTTGRLDKETFYGFQLRVTNGPSYSKLSNLQDRWQVWTYMFASDELVAGVDGSYEPIPFYQNHPTMPRTFVVERRMAFGVYQRNIPPHNFGVSVLDLRPSRQLSHIYGRGLGHGVVHRGMSTSQITIFPIVLGAPSDRNVRILAPAGYRWQFEQVDFKYRSKLTGAPEGEYVEGAEADVPLSLVPNRPIAEPFNELKVDYMKAAWKADTKYGMIAKVMVPDRSPTAGANIFTIEFGYDEDEVEKRLEAGSTEARMVQKLINAQVDYVTNIMGQNNTIYFSVQTAAKIPFAGGLIITGPPLFSFNRENPKEESSCTPKPLPGYPEMPTDSSCTFTIDKANFAPTITITAGHAGIPMAMYRFHMEAVNPPAQVTAANRGSWTFDSYKVVSTKEPLDSPTVVEGFLVNNVMPQGNMIHAVKRTCIFRDQLTVQELALYSDEECDFEDWQYHEPRGLRNDRPGARNMLIFTFTISKDGIADGNLHIRAPEGFVFDTDCLPVTTDETKVFNAINTDGKPPPGFYETGPRGYSSWPKEAVVKKCHGRRNLADLTIALGLKKFLKYVFRIPVLRNPITNPIPNKFILEYNGESSEPFEGFQLWAFTDDEIFPQTRSISLRPPLWEGENLEGKLEGGFGRGNTENWVTIRFRPYNTIPSFGRIRIVAPTGFVIATNCKVELHLHERDEKPDSEVASMKKAEKAVYDQWSKFGSRIDGTEALLCKGETKASYKATVTLQRDTMIMAKMLYVMKILVINPQTMTREVPLWHFESFEDDKPDSILDAAYTPGFTINYAVPQFSYGPPASQNARDHVNLQFTMSFPQTVVYRDTIDIIAPVGFFFSLLGKSECIYYKHILGQLTRTQPSCMANMVTWRLTDEQVAPYQDIVFTIRVINPEATPSPNLFRIRQQSESGVQKSSKVIPGYKIIPDLRNVKITNVAPLHPCRAETNMITGQPCTTTDSFATIGVEFTPVRSASYVRVQAHVEGQHFSFRKSSMLYDEGMIAEVIERTDKHLLVKTSMLNDLTVSFGIDQVQAPPIAGVSSWSITTYVDPPEGQKAGSKADRVDEKLDHRFNGDALGYGHLGTRLGNQQQENDNDVAKFYLPSFEVMRYTDILPTTLLDPAYLRGRGADLEFQVKMGRTVDIGDIITLTRPSNFTILEDPKIRSIQPGVKIGEAGLDVFRRWSASWENPEVFFFVMESVVPEGELFIFNVKVNLPDIPQMDRHWFIKSFKLLPVLDEDGKIVDDSKAPYPWLNRDLKEMSTNDGAFRGFFLIGKIPFTLEPERHTPGARIILTLRFGLESQVIAQNRDGITLVLNAPSGFRFEVACRRGFSSQFRQCIGLNNQARLIASTKRLIGSNIEVGIAAFNPTETPEFNNWSLELYNDVPVSSKRFSNRSEREGYEITTMPVVYRGNNQLAESATGFFTFQPVRPLVRRGYLEVTAPKGLGYQLNCEGVKSISLPQTPICTSEEGDRPLRLELTNATLNSGKQYTFGVGVTNPGAPPSKELNKFGLMLLDIDMIAVDGNMDVDGLELKSIPLRVTRMGWSSAEPQALARIQISIIALHPIRPETISEIKIEAPEGVMLSAASEVKIGPDELPLKEGIPIVTEGNNLRLMIRPDKGIDNGGYNIEMQISNPTVLPADNTWKVFALKRNQKIWTHLIPGYIFGQKSEVEVRGIYSVSASHRQVYHKAGILFPVLTSTALTCLH